MFAVAVAAAVVGFILTLSFGFADHAPAPHGVRLAVAAPAGLARALAAGLAHAAPGGFTVVAVPSASAVTDGVRSQSMAGGLVAGASGPVTIVTAGAAGEGQQQAITAVLTAAATACGSVLALDLIFGALTGAGAGLIGVGFFGALTFVAFVTACQAVTGLPGTGLAALVFVVVGNAVSGGTVPFAFLPGGFRQVAPWLPNGAVVSAARDVVYLPGSDLAHPLLVLAIWLTGSLAVLAGVDLLHLAERRLAPEREAEIYATPGTAHLRQRLARQRSAAPAIVAEYDTSERR